MSAVRLARSPNRDILGERYVVVDGAIVGAIRPAATPDAWTAWLEARKVFRPVALPLRAYPSKRAAALAVVEAVERRRAMRARAVAV